MLARYLLLAILALIAVSVLISRFSVQKSRLIIQSGEDYFPTVSGFNLDRKELEFPRDFAGELIILFVPFLQEQQATVNTWIPAAQELETAYPEVIYYELPTIDEMPVYARTLINEGMRAGIPDPVARQRTVTLYIDTDQFRQALNIPDKNEVHILLVNREGQILWRETGNHSEQKEEALKTHVQANRE